MLVVKDLEKIDQNIKASHIMYCCVLYPPYSLHVITCINVATIHWCIHMSPGLNELMESLITNMIHDTKNTFENICKMSPMLFRH